VGDYPSERREKECPKNHWMAERKDPKEEGIRFTEVNIGGFTRRSLNTKPPGTPGVWCANQVLVE